VHEKSSAQHKFPQRATVKKCNMNNVKLGKWPPPPTRGSTRVLVGGDQNSTDWLFAREAFIHSCLLHLHTLAHARTCSVSAPATNTGATAASIATMAAKRSIRAIATTSAPPPTAAEQRTCPQS
jgi:hypothetical protein